MSQPLQSSTLKVPGATLYYERQGKGPMLLIIPGGPQDAGVFAGLASLLADRYTVVAFDPRGNSRSRFDGAAGALSVAVQADDAAALIETVGGGPAYVFGTSGGAQIGLDLAARYPALVRALVAHEPPTVMLLDDPSAELAANQRIHDTYEAAGVDAAMGLFFGMNALDDSAPPMEMPPDAAETFARVGGNFEYWLAHGMTPLSAYVPDIERLSRGTPRIVVAIGTGSDGLPIARMAAALASKLEISPATFPGDHMGFETEAPAFAAALDEVLARRD